MLRMANARRQTIIRHDDDNSALGQAAPDGTVAIDPEHFVLARRDPGAAMYEKQDRKWSFSDRAIDVKFVPISIGVFGHLVVDDVGGRTHGLFRRQWLHGDGLG